MKKFFKTGASVIALVMAGCMLLISCGSPASAPASSSAAPPPASSAGGQSATPTPATDQRKGIDIPVKVFGVVLSMSDQFMVDLSKGWALPVQINGQDFKFDLSVGDPQSSIDKEVSITQTAIEQGIDAWIGYPINSDAMKPLADKMASLGIYMLTEGNNMDNQTMGMVTDERDGGLLGGKMFVQWWQENRASETPKILVLDMPTAESVQRKPDAFVEYVKQNMPSAVIIGQQDSNGTMQKGMDITSTYITSHPDMNFVFCVNDAVASGALAAIQAAGRQDIAVAGCGGDDNILPELLKPLTDKKGGLAFDVSYAKSSVEFAHNMMIGLGQIYLDPQNVNKNIIDIGFTALTRDNVKDFITSKNEWLAKIGEKPIPIS